MHQGKRSRWKGRSLNSKTTTVWMSVGALAAPHTPRHGSPPDAKRLVVSVVFV
jgi:hypothetical protein